LGAGFSTEAKLPTTYELGEHFLDLKMDSDLPPIVEQSGTAGRQVKFTWDGNDACDPDHWSWLGQAPKGRLLERTHLHL
jgi:hypothetical protein